MRARAADPLARDFVEALVDGPRDGGRLAAAPARADARSSAYARRRGAARPRGAQRRGCSPAGRCARWRSATTSRPARRGAARAGRGGARRSSRGCDDPDRGRGHRARHATRRGARGLGGARADREPLGERHRRRRALRRGRPAARHGPRSATRRCGSCARSRPMTVRRGRSRSSSPGVWAGAINTVVGSGTLVTFPVLLAVGYPPVAANVSNTIGLVPGSVAGAWATGASSPGSATAALQLGVASRARRDRRRGAAARAARGGVRARSCRRSSSLALVGIVLQPRLQARDRRRARSAASTAALLTLARRVRRRHLRRLLRRRPGDPAALVLGLTLPDDLQRINALKNVLAGPGELRRRAWCSSSSPTSRGGRSACVAAGAIDRRACSARGTAAGCRPTRCAR